MNNVSQRQLLGEMGDAFKAWADVYFSLESEKLDTLIQRGEAQDDCIKKNNLKGWSSQKFSKSIKAWCKFHGYKLNPKEMRNKDGRIIRKHKVKEFGTEKETTIEMLYIQTKAEINESTDLPF